MAPCTVVWDWNGTLLDDVDGCVATLNALRARRGMAAVTRDEYRAAFGFPVRAFYESIGFDFSSEPFTDLSRDFIAEYRRRAAEMRVGAEARAALDRLARRGVRHVVVSAMEAQLLTEMLTEHAIHDRFAGVYGTADHTAGSKVEVGAAALRALGPAPERVVVVGDTLHDLELAAAIGCRALLYSGGHQDRARLQGAPGAAKATIIESFAEIDAHLFAPPPAGP